MASANGTHGMNWIRKEKRLAIYLRDGLACAYCRDSVESGAELTLDHVIPHSHGGKNGADNLVTACRKCNSSRGNRSVEDFADAVSAYLNTGDTSDDIQLRIMYAVEKPINVSEAKLMIQRRGWQSASKGE